jgi:hypothetical protein
MLLVSRHQDDEYQGAQIVCWLNDAESQHQAISPDEKYLRNILCMTGSLCMGGETSKAIQIRIAMSAISTTDSVVTLAPTSSRNPWVDITQLRCSLDGPQHHLNTIARFPDSINICGPLSYQQLDRTPHRFCSRFLREGI